MLEGDMLVRSDINNKDIIERTVSEMDIDDRPSIDEVMLEVTRFLGLDYDLSKHGVFVYPLLNGS